MRKILLTLLAISLFACIPVPTPEQQAQQFEQATGLHPLKVDPQPNLLEKTERGYPVLFRAEMGNVWGRYAARMAIGEIGRELGRIGQFLSGSYRSGVGSVVGSPLDRLLSQVIGQPLTFILILKHGKQNVSRLDILSDFSTVTPEDPLPQQHTIGFNAGSIYSKDRAFVNRLLANQKLIDRVAELRSQYIRVDDMAVTFVFAGSEGDWSAEIREHGGYYALINSIMESLADIADQA